MEYNDEKLLNIDDYELMAKAYASELKKRGLMVVHIDSDKNRELIDQIFNLMLDIKSHLFFLGGFLNTSQFYSLNDRQIKKFSLLFDCPTNVLTQKVQHDKTKCFLSFLSHEAELIKNLINLSEKCNYESEIKNLISSRLSVLSQILSV